MAKTSSWRRLGAIVVAASALLLAACGQEVHLLAGEYAPDPQCARVLQKFPRTVLDMPRISTDAQATLAYGRQDAPITVRCGITPPPPTTDRCISVSNEGSAAPVDWINPEADSPLLPELAPADAWVFLSYGREPAIEVVIPPNAGISQPTAVLLAFEKGVQVAEVKTTCVGAFDVSDELPSFDEAN